jgi:chitobiase/beta-hexosaminidase-like protein/pectate lyase-like protein
MFRKFLGLDNWTKWVVVFLFGGTLAAISYCIALRNTQLNAVFSHHPGAGNVPAAGTLQLTATLNSTDTSDDGSAPAPANYPAGGPADGATGPPLTGCGGPTINLNAAMSQSTLKGRISSAPNCALIVFAAGTYNILAPITIPCGVTITGPVASPATAILAAAYTGNVIFAVSQCSRPVTIGYLHFENTGGIYVIAPMSGITITHNQFTNLPANFHQWTDMGIYFDGTRGGTISNAAITNNTFGDPSSCSAVMSVDRDEGGVCNGIFFQGDLDGIAIENNIFTHLEEGFHVICFAGDKCTGSGSPTWNNFVVRWNDFNNIHRIAMEMQPQNASNVIVAFNSYENAFAPSTFTMGISAACCAGISGATVPFVNHNVLLANVKEAGKYIAYAIEWWGNGAQANNNLIQGYWANGIVWGMGGGPWEVRNSVIQGRYMAGPYGCYICDEKQGATNIPTQSGNVTSTTITPVTSIAPTISPAGGAISAATTVTLADTGSNHSIYYTTDGSIPTTSSTLYTVPFAVNAGITVKAIGMWGRGANPKSYPSGYGYVPSAVVSASYTAGSVPAAKVSSARDRPE